MEAATPTDAQRRMADDTAQQNLCCPLCTDHIVGFGQVRPTIPAQLRDQQVRMRNHIDDGDTEHRRGRSRVDLPRTQLAALGPGSQADNEVPKMTITV
jgi:hypothetical protein